MVLSFCDPHRLSHIKRAHNRLESRYSNSSGGSYDEEKSECPLPAGGGSLGRDGWLGWGCEPCSSELGNTPGVGAEGMVFLLIMHEEDHNNAAPEI